MKDVEEFWRLLKLNGYTQENDVLTEENINNNFFIDSLGNEKRRVCPRVDVNINIKELGNAVNISEGGICVLIDTRLSVGCRVNLDLLLASYSEVDKQKSSNPVKLEGVVVRVKFSELFNKYEVGIKFTDTHLHSKEKIKSFIKKYI